METVIVNRITETRKLAAKMAREITVTPGVTVLGLAGELGSGKTVFAKAFAKALGVKENITSPTFVLIKNYKFRRKVGTPTEASGLLVHIDAYRIGRPKELLDLGWQEIISNTQNIVLVEWADRIEKILPAGTILINFEIINEKKRKIIIRK